MGNLGDEPMHAPEPHPIITLCVLLVIGVGSGMLGYKCLSGGGSGVVRLLVLVAGTLCSLVALLCFLLAASTLAPNA